ncbi:MAG: glycosyl hydrolase, partial [Phycisphaerae bacterium]
MRTSAPLASFNLLTVLLPGLFLIGSLSCANGVRREATPGLRAKPDDSAAVKALFANPPREYASAPLWVWNDMLTDDEVVGTLRDLAAQGVKQAFVHPRPGLMTPYLSDEWFRLWGLALKEAERLDMNLWIYDENSYPSGFAGGWVPQEMPESRGRGLAVREEKRPPGITEDVVAVYRLKDDGYENVTDALRRSEKLPDAAYLTYHVVRAADSPWTANRCYVDLLYPGVTEKFLDVTLEAYRRHIGGQFGRRVPGSFTDEPNIHPAGGLPWTDDLPKVFQKRWGYSLLDNLPSLSRPIGDWKRVRHNYLQVLNDLFVERWARPYHDYCEKHNLELTGHYWEHEWPQGFRTPDCMAMYAWHQRPAIDILMNRYDEGVHAQFGNVRSVKEVASVANQLGRARTLCELYGAGGWDLRFEDMKRQGDWLYVLGVNTLDQHLSYISMRGARKHDHPQSFSYQEPWWEAYHVSANYFARL